MYPEEKKQYIDISNHICSRQDANENINLPPDLNPNTHELQSQLATTDQLLPCDFIWKHAAPDETSSVRNLSASLMDSMNNQLDSIDVQADSRNIKPDSINIELEMEKKSSSSSLLKNILTHGANLVQEQYEQRNGEMNLITPFGKPTVFNNYQQPYNLSQHCNEALPNQNLNPNYNNHTDLNNLYVTSTCNAWSCYDETSPNHQILVPNYDWYAAYNSANKIPSRNASWSCYDGTSSNQINPNCNNCVDFNLHQLSQNNSSQSSNDGTPPNYTDNSNYYNHVTYNNFHHVFPNNSSRPCSDGILPNQTESLLNTVHTNLCQGEPCYQQQDIYYAANAIGDMKHSNDNIYCNALIPNVPIYQAAQQQTAQQQTAHQQADQQHSYYAQEMNNNNRKQNDSNIDDEEHGPHSYTYAYMEYEWMKSKARDNGTEQKRKRQTYTHKQTLKLEQFFSNGAYLNKKRRGEISKELSLTERQIKIWFQNRRMKAKKQATRNVKRPVVVYNNLENWDITQL